VNDVYINRKLKQLFGEQGGNPNFRLARTDQTEYRKGTFTDFAVDGTYLRTVTEVRLTRKYNYLGSHVYWVIEKLLPVSGPNAEMLPGRNVSYEPIFVYRKPDGSPMTVSEDSVLSFVHVQLFGERKKRDLVQEELDFYEQQVDKIHQFLSDECSPISILLQTGHAVVNSAKEKLDGRSDDSVVSSPRDSGVQAGSNSPVCNDSSRTDE